MKRFLSIIVTFVLLCNTVVFANVDSLTFSNTQEVEEEVNEEVQVEQEEQEKQEETIDVVVRIESIDDTILKETELEVSNSDLSMYVGEGYGICNTEETEGITALDALLEAIEQWLITDGEMEEADDTTIASMIYMDNGYMSMLMGYADEYDEDFCGGYSWMYLYNNQVSSNGISQQVLNDGDELVFYYGYWSYRNDEYATTKIAHFENKYLEVEQNKEVDITLLSGENVINNAIITLINGDEVEYINNEDGTYTLIFDEVGEYELTASTDDIYGISRPYCKITVTEKKEERIFEAEWGTRRGDSNGITDTLTPRSANEVNEAWITKVTSSWTYTAPISAEVYLYTAAGSNLYKIDKEDGEIISEITLSNSINSVESLTYGEGIIFVPEANGIIEAYDAESLKLLWTSSKATIGTQSLTSVLYEDGYVYSGTYSKDGGAYYCIDIKNPDKFVWEFIEEGISYYWACSVIVDDFIIFGSDGGNLYSLNKKTGEKIDSYLSDGNIRSGIVYEEDTNYLYFTTQNGSIYQVQLNTNGEFDIDNSRSNSIFDGATASTSTPVIYNGRIYVGANGVDTVISVIDSSTLENIYVIPMRAYPQSSMLLSTGYENLNNKVYIYSTYNNNPGGISVIEDFEGNKQPIVSDLYIPEEEQYCICSVIADEDGNLYYKNDSGNLFKISKREIKNKAVNISVIPYGADIIVTDMNGNLVTPISVGNYELEEGTYTYKVSKDGYKTKEGNFEVIESEDVLVLNVLLNKLSSGSSSSDSSSPKKITVSFKMFGDEVHEDSEEHTYTDDAEELPVWIDKTKIKVEKGSTIFDVLDKMAEKYDFEYDEEQYGYISGIQSLDGVWLYEMDNGDYSGWMYRVNDKLVSSGVREYKLKNGDNIIWYYTDNYTLEKETKKFSDSSYEKQNNEEVKEPKVENKIIKFNGDSSLIDNIFVKVTDEDGNEVILWNVIYDEEIGGFKIEADVNSKVELCTFEVKPSEENISHWGYSATMFCLARKIISCELNDMNKYITSNDIKNVQVLFGVEEPINEKSNVTREEMIFELAKCIDSSSSMVIDDNIKFKDELEFSEKYKESINLLRTIGVIKGSGNNMFIPKSNATYAELAAVIKNLIEYRVK